MQYLQRIAAILAFGAVSVTAAPNASPVKMHRDPASPFKNYVSPFRDPADPLPAETYMCTDTHGNGRCQYIYTKSGYCTGVGRDFENAIGSIANLSRDKYECTWYIGSGCNGRSYHGQVDDNLMDRKAGQFDKAIGSVMCKLKGW